MSGELLKFLRKNVRLRMAELNLNQGELADRAGIRRATLNNILNEKTSSTGTDTIEALARPLGVSPDKLISAQEINTDARLKALETAVSASQFSDLLAALQAADRAKIDRVYIAAGLRPPHRAKQKTGDQ